MNFLHHFLTMGESRQANQGERITTTAHSLENLDLQIAVKTLGMFSI